MSWTRTLEGRSTDIAISPANAQTIYVAMRFVNGGAAGVYKSTDGGNSFPGSPMFASPFPTTQDIRVAVSPANAQKIFVYYGDQQNGGNIRLAISTDGGATFPTNLNLNPGAVDAGQFGYNTYLVAHPSDVNTLYVGSRDVFRSTDNGNSWSNLTQAWQYNASTGNWDYPDPNPNTSAHSDQHVLTLSPTNSSVIYIGSDGGLQKSTNGGGTFFSLNDTLSLSQFIGYALHPTNTSLAYGGTQDNGTQRRQVASSVYSHWQEFSGGDGGHCVINSSNASIIFSTYVQCTVQRYLEGGDTYDGASTNATFGEAASPALPRVSFYPPLIGNGINSTLYFGTWRLFVNTDPVLNISNPLAWQRPTTTPADQDLTKGTSNGPDVLTAIGVGHQAYDNQQEIYTGSAQGRVMKSTDGGVTFTDAAGLPDRSVTSITVDPNNSAIAFVTFSGFHSGHVFRITDFGETWSNISANLNQDLPVNAFLLDPVTSGEYYVGTDTGVFRSIDSGGTWDSYNNGLPPVVVNALVGQSSGTIHAATFGRGAYELVKQFDISGRVKRSNNAGIGGVTMTMSGGASATTMTDAMGNYTFGNVTGGLGYSVTPEKAGYTFAPASQSISPLTADTALSDFVGTPPAPVTYTYTGMAAYQGACNPNPGSASNWDDPRNWGPPCSPAGPPSPNDIAVLNDAGTALAHDVTLAGLIMSGNTVIGGNYVYAIIITGTFDWTGGNFGNQFVGGSNLVFEPGSVVNLSGSASKGGYFTTIANQGTITWSGGLIGARINNTGTIDIQADGAFLNGFGSGDTLVNSGTIMKSSGVGTTDFGGAQFHNTGIIDVQTGVIALNEPRVTGSSLRDGTLIKGAGRLDWNENSDAARPENKFGGTITINGTLRLGELNSSEGIYGDVAFAGTGKLEWMCGGFADPVTFANGFTVNVSGGNGKSVSACVNNGTMNWQGGASVNANNGSINNNGAFNVTNPGTVFNGHFTNTGTINTVPNGATRFDGSLTNSGVINVGGVGTAGILAVYSGGDALVQTATGRINMEIGGPTGGTQFDQIQGLSDANSATNIRPGGTLNLSLINNYAPTIGANFQLIHAFATRAAITGTFAQVNYPPINWRTFAVQYISNTDVTLAISGSPTYIVPTPTGTNVSVTAGGVAITFDSVTGSTSPQGVATPLTGTTTITPIDPNSAGPPPSGFIITQDSVAYEITTTVIYTGTIKIDIPLTTHLRSIRSQLGLLHGESSVLVDRTIPTNHFSTISSRVTSLTPFVVAQTVGCVSSVVSSGQPAGSAAAQSFAANAATGSIDVTSQNNCNWTATSTDPWITITSAGGATGNGAVTYSVAENTTTTIRSGSITISGQRFTILQGAAFLDVPTTDVFYTYIGKLSAHGVTVGCGNGNYCPNDPVTREQMAAFIIRALGDFTPETPAQQRFADVLPANPFYSFVDELAVRQITLGCGGGNYCPSSSVLREQMAAFIIRGVGEFSPPTPVSQRFNDVPLGNPFYDFIDRMAVLQITLGCSTSPPLYCPGSPVTRGQMAVFLVRAFNL